MTEDIRDRSTVVKEINQRRWNDVRKSIAEWHPPDIADLLMNLDAPERVLLFRLLPRPLSSEVFSYLSSPDKDTLIQELSDEETRRLLSDLSADDRTDYFEELPGLAVQRLLNMLSPGELEKARTLLGYPEGSVGRLMNPDYVAVRPDWTIVHSLKQIRARGRRIETINVIYVTDEQWKLLDSLELSRFVLAAPENTVSDIMDYSYINISAYEDREEAVRKIQHYDLYALPVVDSSGILLGVVTVDDVLDVVQEEVTEDFQISGAVAPLKTSYSDSGVLLLYKRRIGWLGVLVLVNLAASGVIAFHEKTLASALALAFYIPLLLASGGNAGAQTATLMVRALATGDVRMGQWSRVVLKELAVGALLGSTMGLAGVSLGLLRGGFEIGLVIGLSMVSIVVIGIVIGVLLPFVLTKLKLDPAVASSPLITSIADILGLLIYFTIAANILNFRPT